jgi:CHAT domain-containing protein
MAMERHLRWLRAIVLIPALIWASAVRAAGPSLELTNLEQAADELYRAGDYAAAQRLAERATPLVVAQFGGEHEQTAIHYHRLGRVCEAGGNLALAETYFARSLAIREKVYGPDASGTAAALERLGSLYVRMGRLDAAEPPLRRALNIRQALLGATDPSTAGAVSSLAALSLARGDWAGALASYRQAIRLIKGADTSQTILKAINEEDLRRLREAFVGLDRAAWQLRAGNGPAMLEEAYIAGQLAETTSAASALAKMTARLGTGDSDLGQRVRRLQDTAERILRLQGEDAGLLTQWSKGARADRTYSALLEEFRAASIARGRDAAAAAKRQRELAAELAALDGCAQDKAGCAAGATSRAAIAKELAELGATATAESARLMALHGRLEAAEKALPNYREFAASHAALRDAIDAGEGEARSARAAIAATFPRYLTLAEPRPLTVAATQGLLQEDEALIAILSGSQRSFVWAITRERADWAEIDAGSAALAEMVAVLRRGLDPLAQQDAEGAPGTHAGVVAGFDTGAAHALYRQVLGPVEPVFAAKRHLIVVPSGPLTSLPFQVLLTRPMPGDAAAQDGQALRGASWLIARHALSVLPSVPSLSALRTLPGIALPAEPFFGMGDPILRGADPSERQRGAPPAVRPRASPVFYRNGLADVRAVRELAPLPETAEELLQVAAALSAPRAAVNLREAATEARLKAAPLENYRIVHFATHALVAGELSGLAEPALVLTPPDAPSELDDGLLTASEIATLKLNADWVVLSACNTAAGGRDGAEALSGLARAFFYAGARALLVSHWAVYSEAATELTTRTFAVLAAQPKIGRATALQQVMRGLIAEGKPPGYWAPFIVVGEAGAAR